MASSGAAEADGPVVSDDGLAAGYATVAWADVPGENFVLEEKTTSNGWVVVYSGPDRATTLSGRADGAYEFRLKADGKPVGEPLSLVVSHHPLDRAWAFFSIGALMFVLLTVVLVRGSRQPIPQISPTNAEQ